MKDTLKKLILKIKDDKLRSIIYLSLAIGMLVAYYNGEDVTLFLSLLIGMN